MQWGPILLAWLDRHGAGIVIGFALGFPSGASFAYRVYQRRRCYYEEWVQAFRKRHDSPEAANQQNQRP
jgi:hypothetical protein